MSLFNNDKKSIIGRVASHYGITPEEARSEIIKTIDHAWLSNDPQIKKYQQRLFPTGKPTPEQFIQVLSTLLKSR